MKTESRPWTLIVLGLFLVGGVSWAVYYRAQADSRSHIMPVPQTAAEPQEKSEATTASSRRRVDPEIAVTSRSRVPARSATDTPGRSEAVGQTARSRSHEGWRLIKTGDYQRAVQVFKEASRLAPDDASLLVGLGLCQSRLNQSEQAVENLNRALALDVEVDYAHGLLGDLYFRRDELKDSIRHYEAAVRQDPNDTIAQEGLLVARRAYEAEAHLYRIFSPHFVVKFDKAHRQLANDMIERLERLTHVVGRQLGPVPEEVMIVIFYSDRRFVDLTESPAWAGGLYDGKIHVAAQALMQKKRAADAALAHEYIHAVVHRLSGGHAPTWLQEGLALYFEGRPADWGQDVLARHPDAIVPLHALHGSFFALSAKDAQRAYAEGYGATRVIIDQYGFESVRRLLDTLAVTPEFAAAFEIVFKKPYRDFEAGWISTLTARRVS